MTFTAAVLDKMSHVWKSYGLIATDDLLFNWRNITDAILDHASLFTEPQEQWSLRIVNAETGTGKTTLLTVLLGMMGRLNTDHRILVATPFKDEATRLANEINRIAETPTFAIAQHGEAKGAYGLSRKYPCKVITTNAYIRALHDPKRRDELYAYGQEGEKRGLTVIDEALSPVSVYKMTVSSASRIDSGLPEDIVLEYGMAAHTLNEIKQARDAYLETGMATFAPFRMHRDTDRLLKAVLNSKELSPEFKHEFDNTVNMLRAYASDNSTRYVSSEGKAHAFYAAQSEPILTTPAVILDATAELNLAYVLLPKSKVKWVPVRPVRNYRNATLRVLMNLGTGKNAIGIDTEDKLAKLWRYTEKYRLGGASAIFSHLITRYAFNKLHQDETVRLDANPLMSWGYYGKLNGLNDYKDCYNLLTASFPHQADGWAISLFEALHGSQSDGWRMGKVRRQFIDENGREYPDIVIAILSSYYAYTIVQEINRIAIRKNITPDGDCPEVSIVHMWAAKPLAFQALEAVKATLSNIRIIFDYGFSWEADSASRLKKLMHVLTSTPAPYRLSATALVRDILEGEAQEEAERDTWKLRREDPFADEVKPEPIERTVVKKTWDKLSNEISNNQIASKQVLQALGVEIRKGTGNQNPTVFIRIDTYSPWAP